MAYPPARVPTQQVVSYLRKGFTFSDNGSVLVLGTIPAGALIIKPMSGVMVTTVFNAGSTNVLDIGTTADDDLFGTDLALGTAAFVPLDEAIGGYAVAADTTLTATPALSGTAATTGAGEIVICYVADLDG
ncbi:hypothetical protein [Xanthobacter sp. VNH20]|uniref:hypothetical protein n=1 Tax=Xanthobacter sp. VNH20 TaxID=3156616 RepID=UPI0032B609EC